MTARFTPKRHQCIGQCGVCNEIITTEKYVEKKCEKCEPRFISVCCDRDPCKCGKEDYGPGGKAEMYPSQNVKINKGGSVFAQEKCYCADSIDQEKREPFWKRKKVAVETNDGEAIQMGCHECKNGGEYNCSRYEFYASADLEEPEPGRKEKWPKKRLVRCKGENGEWETKIVEYWQHSTAEWKECKCDVCLQMRDEQAQCKAKEFAVAPQRKDCGIIPIDSRIISGFDEQRREEKEFRKALFDHLDQSDPLPNTAELRKRFI